MGTTTLIICLFLASSINAGITTRTTNATSEPAATDIDTELEKISKGCITIADYKLLTKNVTEYIAYAIGTELVKESVETIGLIELRAALHFGPMAPWTHRSYKGPSEQELASATLEQYYNLTEPKSIRRSLDSLMIVENDIPRGIAFLDGRFPVIRMMFREKFEKMLGKSAKDRKMVDRMIEEYNAMLRKIRDPIDKIYNSYKCENRSY
ncbi:hypothetical protein GCK72_007838 [Caenorhabditis remanei]|uniref:Domain of unknown function WSN domain-containing protein n=1 Tax=Caenorhabditis remanei TaxID=31234 RepID=A0A6A5HK48_CAERE|nr:hypothetical protein GCK72_007838 [Caenorhabditis remanei]KAF1767879.1 hypothetical protein GCK72_007838 [Caenorhabditis remanei]